MNSFQALVKSCGSDDTGTDAKRGSLTTLQVNMGDLCNQRCVHCHVGASPEGKKVISRKVIDDILKLLRQDTDLTLDLTGGAPELNPNFDYLVRSARTTVRETIVRSNLTVLSEPGRDHLPEFFKANRIHLICSMPCYTESNVDNQRGRGAFNKCIEALSILNSLGYGREDGMLLDLVYNPGGPYMPPRKDKLEKDYRRVLSEEHGIDFNRLIIITNAPIKRFKSYLEDRGECDSYLELLADSFNPQVLKSLMCRSLLSVGYDGRLYDCDFNQALGLELTDESGEAITVGNLSINDLEGREIIFGEHCLACTAGSGSSCQGTLAGEA